MRLELSGGIPHGKYLAFVLGDDSTFLPRDFEKYGYVNFDVICIGGAGGNGGSFRTVFGGATYRALGGAGGGGGAHRITGLLRTLPKECPIQVGRGGAPGDSGVNPAQVTRGGDGGTSRFNDDTCYASGGQGGHGPSFPYSGNSFDPVEPFPSGAHGGQGGVGNRSDSGGGANGGSSNPYPEADGWQTIDPTPGENGGWNPESGVGAGGGGGVGGVAKATGWLGSGGEIWRLPTPGGMGSYGDALTEGWVSCPGGYPARDDILGARILPGGAGGANAIDILELPLMAGRSFGETRAGENGAVVIAVSFDD